MKNPALNIACFDRPTDKLHLKAGAPDNTVLEGTVEVRMTLHSDRVDGSFITLDKPKARELFNWLGVFLHT